MAVNVQEQLANLTRQRLTSAVRAMMRDFWLEDLSIQQIATQAAVSVPSIYRHFGSREALISAALEESMLVSQSFPEAPQQLSLSSILDPLANYYEQNGVLLLKIKYQQERHAGMSAQWRAIQKQHQQWIWDHFHMYLYALSSQRQASLEHELVSLTAVDFWAGFRWEQNLSQVELSESWQRILRALLQSYR